MKIRNLLTENKVSKSDLLANLILLAESSTIEKNKDYINILNQSKIWFKELSGKDYEKYMDNLLNKMSKLNPNKSADFLKSTKENI